KGESNIAYHFDDATVIFADVVGFGKITARMKAYEIVACLNQLFSEFDKLAEDAEIEKIKTIGDNYMAVAGVPTPRSNHARTAATVKGLGGDYSFDGPHKIDNREDRVLEAFFVSRHP